VIFNAAFAAGVTLDETETVFTSTTSVGEGVLVIVGESVGVGDRVGEDVAVSVSVGVGVKEGVAVGVTEGSVVAVSVAGGVALRVGSLVDVAVGVPEGGTRLGDAVAVNVVPLVELDVTVVVGTVVLVGGGGVGVNVGAKVVGMGLGVAVGASGVALVVGTGRRKIVPVRVRPPHNTPDSKNVATLTNKYRTPRSPALRRRRQ
jgi:hypothetical protein